MTSAPQESALPFLPLQEQWRQLALDQDQEGEGKQPAEWGRGTNQTSELTGSTPLLPGEGLQTAHPARVMQALHPADAAKTVPHPLGPLCQQPGPGYT